MTKCGASSGDDLRLARGSLGVVATGVAVVVLAVYVVLFLLQWRNVGDSQLKWARHETLLGGIEALAFAAAGALFGTTVQRQVTKKAEQDAARSKADAASSAKDAEKGRALRAAIEAKVRAVPTQATGTFVTRGGGDPDPDTAASLASQFRELLDLADQYD